jgi:hypothetical protein
VALRAMGNARALLPRYTWQNEKDRLFAFYDTLIA